MVCYQARWMKQAYDAFRSTMNEEDTEEKAVINFDREYSIALNEKNGRDAASSILTTVRVENNAQLAIAPIIISLLLFIRESVPVVELL